MNLFENLLKEVRFKASKSSGPGGQNVNKVSTRISLVFDIGKSKFLSQNQKEILFEKCEIGSTQGRQNFFKQSFPAKWQGTTDDLNIRT